MQYCESIFRTVRRPTCVVQVGDVAIGGAHPIRTQSMTTSDTRDVEKTVQQIMRLADAGCEIARITVQGKKEAEACAVIKNTLLQKGYTIPIVADIHFYPPAAMLAVEYVDKIRVNPGNYADKRATFRVLEYDDATYAQELLKIEEKFAPLVERCKVLGKAMRIGTNHGSLSDRVMNRYGDTPQGMVESALEFARICRKMDYHNFLFSMKASNPLVMIQAYRLLVAEMYQLGWDYPLHLGVTEAGQGEDGRVKSAIGMGSLLLDGIGDTIRVSLTEDPWLEIDPCKRLVKLAEEALGEGVDPFADAHRGPFTYQERSVRDLADLPGPSHGHVIAARCGRFAKKQQPDLILDDSSYEVKGVSEAWAAHQNQQFAQRYAVMSGSRKAKRIVRVTEEGPEAWTHLLEMEPDLILFSPPKARLQAGRRFFDWMKEKQCDIPVLLAFSYTCSPEDLPIRAAAECGALLCDGLGEGVMLEGNYPVELLNQLAFNILQATRRRITKTEFISCPSCGRTLFDLQEVTRKIQERTAHLAGVKIAIMGCIVNGPGEMADADFGYVGSRAGMIDLYVGKECVEKNIPFAEAEERLVDLIKAHGRWIDPAHAEDAQSASI